MFLKRAHPAVLTSFFWMTELIKWSKNNSTAVKKRHHVKFALLLLNITNIQFAQQYFALMELIVEFIFITFCFIQYHSFNTFTLLRQTFSNKLFHISHLLLTAGVHHTLKIQIDAKYSIFIWICNIIYTLETNDNLKTAIKLSEWK